MLEQQLAVLLSLCEAVLGQQLAVLLSTNWHSEASVHGQDHFTRHQLSAACSSVQIGTLQGQQLPVAN